jgi:hypothetical protein
LLSFFCSLVRECFRVSVPFFVLPFLHSCVVFVFPFLFTCFRSLILAWLSCFRFFCACFRSSVPWFMSSFVFPFIFSCVVFVFPFLFSCFVSFVHAWFSCFRLFFSCLLSFFRSLVHECFRVSVPLFRACIRASLLPPSLPPTGRFACCNSCTSPYELQDTGDNSSAMDLTGGTT